MRVITITREYGAGGLEVAKRLGEALGWKVLDRELLHQAAQIEQLPDAELDRLDEKAVSMADRFRLRPPYQKYLHGLAEAARKAAQQGNVVLVGRGARHLWARCPTCFICGSLHRATGGRSGCRSSMGRPWNRPVRGAWKQIAPASFLPDISSAMPRCSRPSMTWW